MFVRVSEKSCNYIFCQKINIKIMIDLSDVCSNSSFHQWFSGFVCLFFFFIIHLANLRSVEIVQKSVRSQGIFQLLIKSGNPDLFSFLLVNNSVQRKSQLYN